jgi:bidirectional [NiFe] hydrogenase diaphorase subunit
VAALQAAYSIEAGETTPDGRLSVLTARCLGSCGLAPVLVLDGEVLARQTPEETLVAVQARLSGAGPAARPVAAFEAPADEENGDL